MMPVPLHPAVVHFPIVLVMLLPIAAAAALWFIHRGANGRRAWAFPLLIAAALTSTTWFAMRTGEAEEDRVEDVVGEAALHTHEEAAERMLVLSAVVLMLATLGLLGGTAGRAARIVATAGSFVVVIAGVQVGAAGGDLVYGHNAGSAYSTGAVADQAPDSD